MIKQFIHVLIERTKSKIMSDKDNDKEASRSSTDENCAKLITPDMDNRKAAILMMGMLRNEEEEITEHVKDLMKSNKDYVKGVVTTNVDGWTPFHAFCLRGCRKLLKLSLRAGVDPNLEMGQPEGLPGGCAAIHLAAHRGDVSLIDVLLTNGALVNKRDKSDKTPVYYASRASNSLAVKKLSRSGADMSTIDPEHKLSMDDLASTTLNPFCFLPKVFGIGSKTPKKL